MTYHTFGVEILPNEIRILWDSNVVRRIPDRLVPPNNRMFDVASHLPRSGGNFMIGQFDIDNNDHLRDSMGIDTAGVWKNDPTSVTYKMRAAFERAVAYTLANPATPWAGFDIYKGQPAAHHKIDYVRVWDVPAGMPIPNFPN